MNKDANLIWITPKDIMVLKGIEHYNNARRIHKRIRDALGITRKQLLMTEFCTYEQLEFRVIWSVLRLGKPNPLE